MIGRLMFADKVERLLIATIHIDGKVGFLIASKNQKFRCRCARGEKQHTRQVPNDRIKKMIH